MREIRNGDFLVVFCHFLLPNGKLAEEFKTRLDAAIKEWQKEPRPIVVSGGRTKDTPISQAAAARAYIVSHGIPDTDIHWSEEGHDTLEEVQFALREMRIRGWTCPVIISNGPHLLQADLSFYRQGVVCQWIATPAAELGIGYWCTRFAVLPLTFLDPAGEGFLFSMLRHSRRHMLGSKI